MIKIKKLINDYLGRGKNIILPHSKKFLKWELNISKYSGLVSSVKRRTSDEIAKEWSDKIFSKKFIKGKYTSKIPAVIARQVYVFETIKKNLQIKNKSICDFGAGEGDFLKLFQSNKISQKLFAIEPSLKNCKILKKNKIKFFHGTVENYFKKKTKKQFDIITLIWTLCNTSNAYEIIKSASELINDNGYIIVAESSRVLVPFKKPLEMYFGNPYPDTHPFHFSKNSLTNLLIINKFKPIYINRYIDTDYLVVIAKKTKKIHKEKIKLDNYKEVYKYFDNWYKYSKLNKFNNEN